MPICVIKSRAIKICLCMILVAVMLAISINGSVAAEVFFGYSTRRTPIYNVDTQNKQVAISFDAAWGADKTLQIMETCKEFGANATFFLVGFWVDKYPEITKQIYDQGFEIGTHSNTHPDMTKLSTDAMREELSLSCNMIENITGKIVELFRPPYGAYSNSLLDVCDEMSLKAIQWDVDSLDWKGISADDITTRIINRVKCGSIILCHNNSDHILDALPLVLDRLTKMGYSITSVGDLIYKDNYMTDRNGTQRSLV